MADLKQCDRCKTSTPEDRVFSKAALDRPSTTNLRDFVMDGGFRKQATYDLCPSCLLSFDNWMSTPGHEILKWDKASGQMVVDHV